MSKIFQMVERQVHVARRGVELPDDFDPENPEHLELLERYFDGQDWDREEIVSGELTVQPLTTSDGSSVSGLPELTWDDLNDE